MKTLAYLKASKDRQDIRKQKQEILAFAHKQALQGRETESQGNLPDDGNLKADTLQLPQKSGFKVEVLP